MGQIGCPSLDQLGPDFLWREDWADEPINVSPLPEERGLAFPINSFGILSGSMDDCLQPLSPPRSMNDTVKMSTVPEEDQNAEI